MYPCGGCGKSIEEVIVKINGKNWSVAMDRANDKVHHCPSSFTVEQHLQRIGDLLEKLTFEIHEGFRV